MIRGRPLARDEIRSVWSIDRSEVIDGVYRLEGGTLRLHPEHHDVPGWPPGEAEKYTPILEACCDRGGWAYGLFDDERLVGAAVLDGRLIGRRGDRLQLAFLHVSRLLRRRGWGRRLFDLARDEAARRGAGSLYVSATPSRGTVQFYLGAGCRVTADPDPALFALEPEDIHFECALDGTGRC